MSEAMLQHYKDYPEIKSLFTRIDKLMDELDHVLVAIDGDCASGKTTLAGLLAKIYDCNIIHIDQFFLRPEQRTEERLAEAGGNIDYERFNEEVLEKLKSGKAFSYRPFNCKSRDFDAPIMVQPAKLTIIEGSYSHLPTLANHYDLKVFLSIPEDIQLKRILKRNGEAMCKKFKSMWIPMEKRYAEVFDIRENSDLVFDFLRLFIEND